MARDNDTDTNVVTKKEIVARNDAYTGMLTISLLALLAGCVLLFLDFQRYDYKTKPPAVERSLEPFNPNAPATPEGTPSGGVPPKGGQTNPGGAQPSAPGQPQPPGQKGKAPVGP